MKRFRWHILLALLLVGVSAACYALQIAIFRRTGDTFFYMFQDFAFVPIQVLLVSLVINDMLRRRERGLLRHKMNMVIGAFFSEAGALMLRCISGFDTHPEEIRRLAKVETNWNNRSFAAARKLVAHHQFSLDSRAADLGALRTLMIGQQRFLLDLIGNPNLLEHETFTDLLWALSHLTEELSYRTDLDNLPESDYNHLANDMKRAYVLLISEWLLYVRHLKEDYPFMFSFVLRVNPFEPEASAVVRE